MHTNITGFAVQGNLGIIQLATSGQDSFEYVGCGRALSDKLIEAKELSESGSVNTIFVLNHSEQFVFLMDGDILAGAKQNRVVNTSMLLAPESKSQVPVSCVEHGRWHHASAGFYGDRLFGAVIHACGQGRAGQRKPADRKEVLLRIRGKCGSTLPIIRIFTRSPLRLPTSRMYSTKRRTNLPNSSVISR